MPKPSAGDVWLYPYLWRRQYDAGETEGRKSRPIAFVASVVDKTGATNLFILPITSQPPGVDRLSLEVPQIERKRAGLDDMTLWILLDEYNHDILERSYYFEPGERLGAFSSAFHRKVLRTFVAATRRKQALSVRRSD
ncbi:hypothetical protein DUP91_27830 [Salmonella enterica subsp. enterica]|nr:hypothetical protein [Salmonella enterica subsp. enterica]